MVPIYESDDDLGESTTTAIVRAQAGPLIPELRRQRYFFKGYHDDANMEIIVPNKLSAFVSS